MLLDEVEKAHPDVFDVLLQVLDDGRLTDGQGRTVDFRNTILILTSNLGSAALISPTLDADAKRDAVLAVVREHFKPEFLNRLGRHRPVRRAEHRRPDPDRRHPAGRLADRLAARRLTLDVTDAAREWLALTGSTRSTAPGRCAG